MTEFLIFYHMIDNNINKDLQSWLVAYPDFVPYGETKFISNNNSTQVIQPFVKYTSKLSDQFLETFIKELKHIPGVGTAYQAAEEQYNEDIKLLADARSTAGVKKGGKNKKTRKYRKK